MRNLLSSIGRFLTELRRRKVYQVALAYLAAGFVIVELADIATGAFGLPGWFQPMVWTIMGLGFPVALILAWALEVTPEGVRVEGGEEAPEEAAGQAHAPAMPSLWVGASMLALVLLFGWWYFGGLSGENASNKGNQETPVVEERSIAVLPFETLGEEKPGAFTEGIHDDLLTRLSNVSDLKVISRTSVEKYRDTDLSLPAIADSLGVRWIVEGGVRQAERRVRINAQLIDPRSDTHRWAEAYDRDLSAKDVFAIQGEIAGEITEALQAEVTPGEQERIAGAPTQDLKAFRLYAKGRSHLNEWTEESTRSAIERFRQAIRQDSSYALAWSGLAEALMLFEGMGEVLGWGSPPEVGVGPEEAARRALKLDPELAEAHAVMGDFHSGRNDFAEALSHWSRAIELKPSLGNVYVLLGNVRLWQGRPRAALDASRLAVEVNPEHSEARHNLFVSLIATGKYEEALAQARQLRRRHPERFGSPATEVFALTHLKRWGQARKRIEEYRARAAGRISELSFFLALADLAGQDTTQATKRLARLKQQGNGHHHLLALGMGYGALGKVEKALSAWREWEIIGSPVAAGVLQYYYPDVLGPLRRDPRFEELIRDIREARGLNPDGSIPGDASITLPSSPQPDA